MSDDRPRLSLPVSARDHASGAADAPATLVEYGDYECPHCGRAYPIVQAIQARLGDRLRFVFRNFPLAESHPHAQHAAEAAEIAGAHGDFWRMHDLLFEHQNALGDAHLARYAIQAGVDERTFAADFERHRFRSRVREDFRSGLTSGVNGTPTFFINDERYDGSWDFDTLLAALESGASPRTHRRTHP
jgi:protein-disulfide isomerase